MSQYELIIVGNGWKCIRNEQKLEEMVVLKEKTVEPLLCSNEASQNKCIYYSLFRTQE